MPDLAVRRAVGFCPNRNAVNADEQNPACKSRTFKHLVHEACWTGVACPFLARPFNRGNWLAFGISIASFEQA